MTDLNAVAKKYGYEFAEDTGIKKDGYEIYSLEFSQSRCVGLPAFLLVKGTDVKMVGGIEGEDLQGWLCDNYPDDDDEDTEE